MKHVVAVLALLPLVVGCDALKDRMGIPDPAKVEAEGKAVGGACRHAGRGLEDCYRLNPTADKSAVFVGWKEMNEYMLKNKMESVTPQIPAEIPRKAKKKKPAAEAGEAAAKDAAKDAAHGEAAQTAPAKPAEGGH
ncbi:MAG: hypothetical protein ACOZB0_02840 [Pseudomonadota bacterium]